MVLSRFKQWIRYTRNPELKQIDQKRQELKRIKEFPRYTPLSTWLLGESLTLVDGLSFFYSYKEIFEQKIYQFKTDTESPLIIDGGSNIGLSVIFFKQHYPQSKIIAFEADPNIFKVLKTNIVSFAYDDVHLNNRAIWNSETVLDFALEGADGGRINREQEKQLKTNIPVETVRLQNYLKSKVDFLKLDIEGAETDVILDSADYLDNVDNIFVEYHSFVDEKQRIDELLNSLIQSGFRIQIQTKFSSSQPLIKHPNQLGMDLQLNIFGYKN